VKNRKEKYSEGKEYSEERTQTVLVVERVHLWCANSLPFSMMIMIIDKPNREERKKTVACFTSITLLII